MKKTKILSIDGGGSRGIIPATILNCIYRDTGKKPIDIFDVFAGTSTGGILILGLAVGLSTEEIVDIYEKKASRIFKDHLFDDIRDMGNLVGAQYDNQYLKEIVEKICGDKTLGDLDADYKGEKQFLIPAFLLSPQDEQGNYSNFRPEVFNSYYIKCKDEKLVDLALRTSAGPTYFPIYQNFIDGGVAINHPAMAAVSFAINQHDSEKAVYCHRSPHSKGLKLKVNDLRVLSLGCGTSNGNYIPPQSISTGDWGIFQWKDYIADLLTETNVSASEYYVKQVLAPDDYWRCQLRFDAKEAPVAIRGKKMGLDVTSKTKLKAMKAFAEQYYETNKKKLLRFLGLRQKRRS